MSDSDNSEEEDHEEIQDETDEEEKEDEKEEEEDKFLITLCAMRKNTKWRFPNTNICPHRGCHYPFENSSETIQHYLKTHVLTAVWCSICRSTVSAKYYSGHFKVMHRDKPLPSNWRHILVKLNSLKVNSIRINVQLFQSFNYSIGSKDIHVKIAV